MSGVTPHIVVSDAGEAAGWYSRAFGAEEVGRVPLPGGRVMTVELLIAGTSIHVGSEFPQYGILAPPTIGGTATVLQIETDDAQAAWERALAAGAQARGELTDQFWGERHGQLEDPYGHRWNIAQRLRTVPDDEIAASAAALFGG